VHLLQPHIRVLREVSVVEQGQTEPTHYLALGHDILSVGLAEAMARLALIDQRQSRESRRLFAKMLAIPLLIGLLAAALPLCAALLGVSMDTSLKALVTYGFYGLAAGFYVVMGYEAFSAKLPAGVVGFPKLLAEHVRRPVVVALDETPTAIVTKLFEPFAILRHFGAPMKASGLLFRAMTNDARREAAAEGQVVFPGGARY